MGCICLSLAPCLGFRLGPELIFRHLSCTLLRPLPLLLLECQRFPAWFLPGSITYPVADSSNAGHLSASCRWCPTFCFVALLFEAFLLASLRASMYIPAAFFSVACCAKRSLTSSFRFEAPATQFSYRVIPFHLHFLSHRDLDWQLTMAHPL